MKKAKYIATILVFAVLILGLSLWQLIEPDKDVSYTERRELATAPELTLSGLFSREFSDDLESYLLDQFPMRDGFREINSVFRLYGLRQLDSNGIWIKDGSVFKTESILNRDQVAYAARLYNSVYEKYLEGLNVYFSIVPDKSYFVAEQSGRPHIDFEELVSIMKENVKYADYIDIFDTLSIEDYYRTDTHWQEQLIFPVVRRLADSMGMADKLTPESEYTAHTLSPFYGVYLQQSALPIEPDTLTYLTSDYTENAIVSGPMYKHDAVYIPELIDDMDGYDVFLEGTQPIIEIECPNARTDRELYIFRDSFGSSLAPLFTGAYSKITVIDLRYITSQYLGNYVTFTPDSDVLFINSTLVLNTGTIMR